MHLLGKEKWKAALAVVVLGVFSASVLSAQTRTYASDRYAVKDLGEFRLPRSLRPAYDSQVIAGVINQVKGSNVSFASAEKIANSLSAAGAEIHIYVEGCDDRPCGTLTDVPYFKDPLYEQKYARTREDFFSGRREIPGVKALRIAQEPTIKEIPAGKAVCFALEMVDLSDGHRFITGVCGIDNFDRRYGVSFFYDKEREAYWKLEVDQLLNSLIIPDRSPRK